MNAGGTDAERGDSPLPVPRAAPGRNEEERTMNRIDIPYLWLTVAYAAFLGGIVVLADLGLAPWVFAASKLVSWGDKPSHLLLMGILSFFLNMAWCGRTVVLFRCRVLLGSAVVCGLVLVEELSQAWVPSRHADPVDAVCDLIGVYLFGLLALYNLRHRRTRRAAGTT